MHEKCTFFDKIFAYIEKMLYLCTRFRKESSSPSMRNQIARDCFEIERGGSASRSNSQREFN